MVPDPRDRWQRGKEERQPQIAKAAILSTLGAVAAFYSAEPKETEGTYEARPAVGTFDRTGLADKITQALESDIKQVRRNLESEDVKQALEGKGSYPLSRIFNAIEIPILAPHLEGTQYDTKNLHERYPVQIARDPNGKFRPLTIRASAPRALRGEYINAGQAGYGNGVYFKQNREEPVALLTAAHVVASVVQRQELGGYILRNPDLGFLSVSGSVPAPKPENIVQDDPSLTDADIHGSLVSIVGIDPDATGDPETGRKTYSGVAVKISSGLARVLGSPGTTAEKMYRNSFMVILPPGEGKEIGPGIKEEPALGMSGSPAFCSAAGSPVFMKRGDGYAMCGIFWGFMLVTDPVTKRQMEVAFFHGIDQVRAAAKGKHIEAK